MKNTDLSISAHENNFDWSHDITVITQLIHYKHFFKKITKKTH